MFALQPFIEQKLCSLQVQTWLRQVFLRASEVSQKSCYYGVQNLKVNTATVHGKHGRQTLDRILHG